MADQVLSRPKMTHKPFLRLTLSTAPLGSEVNVGVTCQYVLAKRKRSRGKGEGKQTIEGASQRNGDLADPGIRAIDDGFQDEQKRTKIRQSDKKRKAGASQEIPRGRKRVKQSGIAQLAQSPG